MTFQSETAESRPKTLSGFRSARTFTVALTACFFAADLFNLLHHEMWRDELQAWLIATHSNSILELVKNIRYEGHPPVWFLLLYVITRFTHWAGAMQLLNLAIATATTYLIAAYSPFTRMQKVLLCFGYFPLYEYGTISRNYAVGLLFLFWFCAWYRPDRKQNWVVAMLLLSLLANTSVYGAMIAMAFAFSFFAFPAATSGGMRKFLAERGTHVGVGALVFLAGIAIAILQMHPPPDSGLAVGWHFPMTVFGVRRTLTGLWRAFLPIPSSLAEFWNSNFFFSTRTMVLQTRWVMLGAAVMLSTVFLLLVRKPYALLAYFLTTTGILTFMHVKFFGYERHLGHLFIVFIASLWIAARLPEHVPAVHPLERASRFVGLQGSKIITCLLLVQFAVAAMASWSDYRRPFSQAKAVAMFLRSRGMANMFIVADEDYVVMTVAGYLDREVYYPRSQRMGSFLIWNQSRHPRNVIAEATTIATSRKEEVLIISDAPLQTEGTSAHKISEFTGSIAQENYYLYSVASSPGNGS